MVVLGYCCYVVAGVAGSGEEEGPKTEDSNQMQVDSGVTEENTPVVSVESEESETSVSADQQAEENKELPFLQNISQP